MTRNRIFDESSNEIKKRGREREREREKSRQISHEETHAHMVRRRRRASFVDDDQIDRVYQRTEVGGGSFDRDFSSCIDERCLSCFSAGQRIRDEMRVAIMKASMRQSFPAPLTPSAGNANFIHPITNILSSTLVCRCINIHLFSRVASYLKLEII